MTNHADFIYVNILCTLSLDHMRGMLIDLGNYYCMTIILALALALIEMNP